MDLRKQNEALLMKNWHKFYNRLDIPWVNLVWEKLYPNGKLPGNVMKGGFWWTGNLKILKDYKDLATVQIRNGQTCQLWEDNWSDIPAKLKFPEIFSFTKKTRSFLSVRQKTKFSSANSSIYPYLT